MNGLHEQAAALSSETTLAQSTPLGYCRCGCGNLTNIADHNDARKGWIDGRPLKYCANHHKFRNITGKKFNRLTAMWIAGRQGINPRKSIMWLCCCSCGALTLASTENLAAGRVKSCGCYRREICISKIRHRHTGITNDPRYGIWHSAKLRAKRANLPFDIRMTDIFIPAKCPLLDISLKFNRKRVQFNSPSLDRIVPELGYTLGNIQIISHRANSMKHNATLEEMKTLVGNWESIERARHLADVS